MSVAKAFDTSGIAVITGGASGFGYVMAERLVKCGMKVAVLDVSQNELNNAKAKLNVLPVLCNVANFDDCLAAYKTVIEAFPGVPISFLFNNAGIMGREGGKIIEGGRESMQAWKDTFSVNVFGAVNVLKTFLPGMIDAGPLASGKKTIVVTTSSVVGLLNHNIGPYSCSKMAATAIGEQLSLELASLGEGAAHISPHTLHPTVAATNLLSFRNANGQMRDADGVVQKMMIANGAGSMTSAQDIIDGLFVGLDDGKHYIILDHPSDIPTRQQIELRMQDIMEGRRPRAPEQLGMLLKMVDSDLFAKRMEKMKVVDLKSKL